MQIVYGEPKGKEKEAVKFRDLVPGDLFSWGKDKFVYMKTDNGYVALRSGSAHAEPGTGIVRLNGELTVWEEK
ncbi:hypothetical protein LCGC14_2869140 [marine sediment metagenome]|uniref:Uncharacterized protein n=1 Tax=marine sediment metagenome TaxID=412755 RepID=A0A0F9ABR2_9ZZZZ